MNKQKKAALLLLSSVVFALSFWGTQARAAQNIMTFEGLTDGEYVNTFYNGGTGGSGSGPGANYGVWFPGSTYASIDADNGGSGNFGGEPSPNTAISFQQFSAWMNVEPGFSGSLSFYYSNPNNNSVISVYSDINGKGNLLASLFLPKTAYQGQLDPTGNLSPLVFASVGFTGVAKSVDFVGLANSAYVDDITLGTVRNGDGEVSMADVVLILKSLTGRPISDPRFSLGYAIFILRQLASQNSGAQN